MSRTITLMIAFLTACFFAMCILVPAGSVWAEPPKFHKMKFQKGLYVPNESPFEGYNEHLDNLHSKLGFKEEEEEETPGNPAAYVEYRTRVLVSNGPPRTNFVPAHRHSRIEREDRFEPKALTQDDFRFLEQLAGGIGEEQGAQALMAILERQKQGELLEKVEYDFLIKLSKGIDNDLASYRLYGIAEKRRKKFY